MAAVLNHAGSIDKITFFMEECKRMSITVLGPDINESNNGFAVNKKGEIRFGFSGIKGVGEAAIDCIIEDRVKNGPFKDIFDLVKRVNLRAVSKKSIENLVYSGAFDCFEQYHRAQYLFQAPGDTSSLEKIVKFGSVFQTQASSTANTLFGEMQMPDIIVPKLPPCPAWQLIEQLDYEKEVTGMYMSGHPLDNFKFELTHYKFTPLNDYTDVKNTPGIPPLSRPFRMAGLVIDGQHRLTKTGKNFGVMHLEDFSGKAEFMLWGEDYVKYNNYLEKGRIVFIEGGFKQRFNTDQYEFKISKLHLLDSVKTTLTKQIILDIPPQFLDEAMISFIDNNIQNHPGNTSIKFNIVDRIQERKISLTTLERGFTMNDEMSLFLHNHQNIDVTVLTA
jgi:DNA polymerase-3 subunit alpha